MFTGMEPELFYQTFLKESSCSQDMDNDSQEQTISDLEAHFNAHFNLAVVEKCNKRKELDLEKMLDQTDDNLASIEADFNYEYGFTKNCDSIFNPPDMFIQSTSGVQYTNLLDSNYENNVSIDNNLNVKYNNWCNNVINETHSTDINNWENDDVFFNNLCDYAAERNTPDSFTDDVISVLNQDNRVLPSVGTAFSKHFHNFEEYSNRDASIPTEGRITCNNLDLCDRNQDENFINNLDNYCYPNNILENLSLEKYDTDNDSGAVNDTRVEISRTDDYERRVSVSDSMISDTEIIFEELENGLLYDENDEEYVDFEILGSRTIAIDDTCDSSSQNQDTTDDLSYSDDWKCSWQDCGGSFPSQNTLVTHIEKIHVNSFKGDEFSCLWIGCARDRRPFNARYKLLIHMRVHSGHKPNICNHPGCGKSFSRLENLKIHRRSHTGERPYSCHAPNCRKAFSNSSDRAKHQRTHFNARPYACQIHGCTKSYTDPSSLRKHVKNHAMPTAGSSMSNQTAYAHNQSSHNAMASQKLQIGYRTESNISKANNFVQSSKGFFGAHAETLRSVRNKIMEQNRGLRKTC